PLTMYAGSPQRQPGNDGLWRSVRRNFRTRRERAGPRKARQRWARAATARGPEYGSLVERGVVAAPSTLIRRPPGAHVEVRTRGTWSVRGGAPRRWGSFEAFRNSRRGGPRRGPRWRSSAARSR